MCIEFNKENIQRDFDIYVISKNSEKGKKENFFGKNVLDLPQQKFKAQSVVYTYGNTWYVMFAKDTVDKYEFKKVINEEVENTTVEKINILYENIYPNILAKLLFNILQSDYDGRYTNITGKLFYMNRKWMNKKKNELDSFYCLEVKLDKNMNLRLDVVTFSKIS